MPEDRRLAAIMFTDIVGYTALMGSDEDKAFRVLRKNRNIQKPLIKKYHGKWLKEMGDGILASFNNSSDAVRCAGEIQNKAKKAGIPLRIGIHEGEVVFEGRDVLGDGVNVASRLEELADDGCIYISGAVYKDIKNKAGIVTEFVEEKKLKNVDELVKVYKVHCDVKEEIQEVLPEKPQKKRSYYIIGGAVVLLVIVLLIWFFYPRQQSLVQYVKVDKSIAVLPFINDSPDQGNEYFCNGMMEDILTNLQRISELKVKSRTDVEQYRVKRKTIAAMGAELGVSYILEGSVRKVGDNLRITAQLIDVNTGDHLWANTYDGKYTDEIFEFQGEIAEKVASSLNAIITSEEVERIEKKPTDEIIAYDYLIKARSEIQSYWRTLDTMQLKLSHKLIDKALKIDPQYLEALALKGNAYVADRNYDSVYIYARKVLDIDPNSASGYHLLGEFYRFNHEYDSAIKNYLITIEQFKQGDMVNYNLTFLWIGEIYCRQKNDYLKGLSYIQEALNLDRTSLSNIEMTTLAYLGQIFAQFGNFEEAERFTKKMIALYPDLKMFYIFNMSEILFMQGDFEQAINILDSICNKTLNEIVCNRQMFYAYTYLQQSDQSEYYRNRYFKNGVNPYAPMDSIWFVYNCVKINKEQEASSLLNYYRNSLENRLSRSRSNWALLNLSAVHAISNNKEESLRYLSEAVELGQGSTMFNLLRYNPIFKGIIDDPEFKRIIERNNKKLKVVQAQIEEMREKGEIDFKL